MSYFHQSTWLIYELGRVAFAGNNHSFHMLHRSLQWSVEGTHQSCFLTKREKDSFELRLLFHRNIMWAYDQSHTYLVLELRCMNWQPLVPKSRVRWAALDLWWTSCSVRLEANRYPVNSGSDVHQHCDHRSKPRWEIWWVGEESWSIVNYDDMNQTCVYEPSL